MPGTILDKSAQYKVPGTVFGGKRQKGARHKKSARHLFVDKPAFVVDWLIIYHGDIVNYSTFSRLKGVI